MKQAVKPSGTEPTATHDSLLAEELDKLKIQRLKIKDNNQQYIDAHPELRTILDEFVSAVISHKPNDLIKFGSTFFGSLRQPGGMGPSPIVFAGPSGVGKGTLINMLMEKYPKYFGFSTSHTTRPARPGEENGVQYNFVSKADMEAAIERGEFIEHAVVHTNMYGTSFGAVDKVRSKGKICILDIDIQGVQSVKNSKMDCKYIFISPPSIEELEGRLRGRGTETEEKIRIRLHNAQGEMAYGHGHGNFDSIIVNNDVNSSFEELVTILQNWYIDFDFDLTLPGK